MAVKRGISLASNATSGLTKEWRGGKCMLIATATWSAGSIKLQMPAANGTFVDIPNSNLSADGALVLDLPNNPVKLVIATATAVYADLLPISEN